MSCCNVELSYPSNVPHAALRLRSVGDQSTNKMVLQVLLQSPGRL